MKRLPSTFVALVATVVVIIAPVSAAQSSPVARHGSFVSIDSQKWLCGPTVAKSVNPCVWDTTTTSVAPNGIQSRVSARPAGSQPVDCFFLYPTVSGQGTLNSNLTIQPAERNVAVVQASPFSSVCRVFAPMYPQITLKGLTTKSGALSFAGSSKGQSVAYAGVVHAWNDYLARYNDDRGVVLIGHSQGAYLLRELIAKQIDANTNERQLLVSALLIGGNVEVPRGHLVGGDFANIAACTSESQFGCVVAFSAYASTPPRNSVFGRTVTPGRSVLCTNPSALASGTGTLDPLFPTRISGYSTMNDHVSSTSWVTYPSFFRSTCDNVNGASWLDVTAARHTGDTRPRLTSLLPATWGLHQIEMGMAMGNFVELVSDETSSYVAQSAS